VPSTGVQDQILPFILEIIALGEHNMEDGLQEMDAKSYQNILKKKLKESTMII